MKILFAWFLLSLVVGAVRLVISSKLKLLPVALGLAVFLSAVKEFQAAPFSAFRECGAVVSSLVWQLIHASRSFSPSPPSGLEGSGSGCCPKPVGGGCLVDWTFRPTSVERRGGCNCRARASCCCCSCSSRHLPRPEPRGVDELLPATLPPLPRSSEEKFVVRVRLAPHDERSSCLSD
jgi:hypothetical protein